MKVKKQRPAPMGSFPASPSATVLIEQLIKVRKQSAVLAKRSKLLRAMIMDKGCGAAHGYRTYVAHVSAGRRMVTIKAHDELKVVEI